MTITSVATPSGSIATGAAQASIILPGTILAGDKIILIVGTHGPTPITKPSTPAGFTELVDFEGGAGTWGAMTGPVRVNVWEKAAVAGDASGNVIWDVNTALNAVCTYRGQIFRSTSGAFLPSAVTTASDTNIASPLTGAGAATLDYMPPDWVVAAGVVPGSTGTSVTAATITVPGCTLTAVVSAYLDSTSGNDVGMAYNRAEVTAGSASGPPTLNCPITSATDHSGVIAYMRVREVAASAQPKVWTGSAWASKPAKIWTGSAWVTKPVKRWTGSAWAPVK